MNQSTSFQPVGGIILSGVPPHRFPPFLTVWSCQTEREAAFLNIELHAARFWVCVGLLADRRITAAVIKQIRKGDLIDAIFYCPYEIQELVTEDYLSRILAELDENHKELLFLWAVRLFSSLQIAAIRRQSDRNIRKVRTTMLKKIRKKLLAALTGKVQAQQPLTLQEKAFLMDDGIPIDSGKRE